MAEPQNRVPDDFTEQSYLLHSNLTSGKTTILFRVSHFILRLGHTQLNLYPNSGYQSIACGLLDRQDLSKGLQREYYFYTTSKILFSFFISDIIVDDEEQW